jgi:hypothetical protein
VGSDIANESNAQIVQVPTTKLAFAILEILNTL